jgi:hypothetical protein
METIIVKPKNEFESKAVLDFLKKTRIKAEIYKEPSRKEILNSIEQGAREVQLYLNGKVKLKEAKHLLEEI